MSKYLNYDGLLYFYNKLKTLFAGKVDKVDGKGLSTNDYTTDEKTKLAGLNNYVLPAASAETLGGVKVGSGLSITAGALSIDAVDWTAVKNTPDFALKTDIAKMYKYKGSKASFAALPATDNVVGDVWNTEDTGMNYGWTGDIWDPLGQTFEIQTITNAEIDTITA